ncbi:MAG: hypothetical protein ACI8ZN_000926 [Bacteroidia bacterium]
MKITFFNRWREWLPWVVWILVGLAFVFELIRDSQRDGDFIGYVHAGQAVLSSTNIYADYLNTWPPFFSIFSVPLTLAHNFSPILIRIIWLLGIMVAWYWIINSVVKIVENQSVSWFYSKSTVLNTKQRSWLNGAIIIPFVFVLRFIIDDLSNIQINTFLLAVSILVFKLSTEQKWWKAGFALALIISLKVYPVFILLFFLYKRAFKISLATLLFLILINASSFLVFGVDLATTYYQTWMHDKALGDLILIHKNQSIFAFLGGLFMDVSRGFDFKYNVLSLSEHAAKLLSYGLVGCAAILPAFLFRKSWKNTSTQQQWKQFAWILAAIPVLSPLAWKYYFVFLFPLIYTLWNNKKESWSFKHTRTKILIAAAALLILTTDGLLPPKVSDYFEIFGCITWGTVLLLGLGLEPEVREGTNQ